MMQLCGCLPVGNANRNEKKKVNVKQSVKRYSLKRGMFSYEKNFFNFIVLIDIPGNDTSSSTGVKYE